MKKKQIIRIVLLLVVILVLAYVTRHMSTGETAPQATGAPTGALTLVTPPPETAPPGQTDAPEALHAGKRSLHSFRACSPEMKRSVTL